MAYYLLVASNSKECVAAYANVEKSESGNIMLYRVLSKWLIRGTASALLRPFWEYIDQNDNDLEEALLDQLNTQALTATDDPQTTTVRTKDYAIDFTVKPGKSASGNILCTITFGLYMYLHSIKSKTMIEESSVTLTMIHNMRALENISVGSEIKTPAQQSQEPDPRKKVQKRSSKIARK